MTRYIGRRKNYKVGDKIFFEFYDGTVGTAIVLKIESKSYVDDNGKTINYNMLTTWKSGNCSSGIEDYNTLPYSDPRVKELMKELKKQEKVRIAIKDFVTHKFGTFDNEIIAKALGEVAIEYGYDFDL